MAVSSQSIRRSLRGSSPIVNYSRPIEPGSSAPEFRKLWQSTGSLNERGEFRQWLHIFTLASDPQGSGAPSVSRQYSLPWVNLMPKPCLETLEAMHHIARFRQFPAEWEDRFSYYMQETDVVAPTKGTFGPYWMLLAQPGAQCLAQSMVGLKRRLQNEMFREHDPWSARDFERRVIESMEPFLIHQSENNADVNETDGPREGGSGPL